MKAPTLNPQEIQNLSDLLLSTDKDNIEVGFQILSNYPEVVPIVYKELVLISQLSWLLEQQERAYAFLLTHFEKEQLDQELKGFQVFHIYTNLYDKSEFDENWHWFEKHEAIRESYMPFIKKNAEYAGEYYAIADTLAHYYKKRLDWAERYYHILLEYNPFDLNTISTLADLYKDGYHDYPKALAYYDKMLACDKRHYDALVAKGVLLFDYIKDIPASIDLFELALEYHPNDVHLEIWLADALMVLNTATSFPKGKAMIQTLLEKNPTSSFAWTIYANRLWITEKLPQEAEKAYLKGIELNPRNYNLLGNLAELYDQSYHDYDKAKECYVKAFSLFMDDEFHLINYISLLVLKGKELEESKDYYEHLQGLNFGPIKKQPELTDLQWKRFQEAEQLILKQFPELHNPS